MEECRKYKNTDETRYRQLQLQHYQKRKKKKKKAVN